MNKQEIIAKAVLEQTKIGSKFGAKAYNVSELMELNNSSLNELYTQLADLKEKTATKSLFDNEKKSSDVEFKMLLLKTIFDYKKELADKVAKAAKTREDNNRKLGILLNAKEAAEIERIKALSPEELEKEIAEATSTKE